MRPLNCFAPYSDAPLRAPCSVRFGRSGAAPLRCSVLRCSAPNLRAGAPCRSGATPLRCSALRCSVPERPCRSSATPLRCSVAPLLRCTGRSCIAAERSLRDQLHRSPSTRQRRSGATAQRRICAPWHLNKSSTAQRRNGACARQGSVVHQARRNGATAQRRARALLLRHKPGAAQRRNGAGHTELSPPTRHSATAQRRRAVFGHSTRLR